MVRTVKFKYIARLRQVTISSGQVVLGEDCFGARTMPREVGTMFEIENRTLKK